MKNKRNILIFSLVLVLLTAGIGYKIMWGEIKISGIITEVNNGLSFDGDYTIQVDKKWTVLISYSGYLTQEALEEQLKHPLVYGEMTGNIQVGAQVEVYGKKMGLHTISREGSKDFYVRVTD